MKHDHKPTEKLKVVLFSSVMLLPLIAVGVTALTHVFNKETGIVEVPKYETIDNTYIFDENAEINFENLNLYGKYVRATNIVEFGDLYTKDFTLDIGYNDDNFSLNLVDFKFNYYLNVHYSNPDDEWINVFDLYDFEEGSRYFTLFVYFGDEIEYFDFLVPSGEMCGELGFNLGYMTLSPVPYEDIPKMSVSSNEESIFYYSIDRLKENKLINWVNESPLKQPIDDFTGVFGIQQDNFITLLINYWLNIMLMYVIFDIVIEIFILISHIFIKEV